MAANTTIDPDVDAYGRFSRAGALADYVEVRALKGNGITAAVLEDIAHEQGWSHKKRRMILIEGDDPESDAAQWSEMAFAEIAARMDILTAAYPFSLKSGVLTYTGPSDPRLSSYVSLLAITVVHAWDLVRNVEPTVVLEGVVRRALENRELLAVDMGTGDRDGLSFQENLLKNGRACGLTPTDHPRPVAAYAKDAGVDTLGTLIWPDRRQGQWVFIGQVTCGSSTSWKLKLHEPEAERWRNYLQEALPPQTFLAVPHHVDHHHWTYLMATKAGMIIDRLRLAYAKGPNTADECSLIESLLMANAV